MRAMSTTNLATILLLLGDLAPHTLYLEPIKLAHGGGHDGLVCDSGEYPVTVVFVLAANVLLEVVTEDNIIGLEKEPNRAINGGTTGEQL